MLRNQGRRPVTLSWTNTTALAAVAAAKAALRQPSAAAAAAGLPAEVRGCSADKIVCSWTFYMFGYCPCNLRASCLHPANLQLCVWMCCNAVVRPTREGGSA